MPINDPAIRRKRLIRLSVLAAIVLCIGGGVYTLFQINRTDQIVVTDEQIIAQAQDAYEEDDYELVVELLENPRNGDTTLAAIDDKPELLRMYITARQDIPMYNNRHLTRTVTPLKKIIALQPDDRQSQNQLLDALLKLERYDETIKHANQFANRYPDDASVLRKLAHAQRQKNQRGEALATLYRAAELEPLHVLTYAEILDLLQAYDQPIDPLVDLAKQVYDAYPDDPRAMMIQAITLEAHGDGVQARDLLKQASEKAPGDQAMVPLLVRWLDRLGMFTTATSYLHQHAEPGIDSPAARLAIYRAFEASDHQAILDRLQDSDPTQANSDLLAMWASALLHTGDQEPFKKHIELLEQRSNIIATTWAKLLKLDQQGSPTPARVIDTIVTTLESQNDEPTRTLARQHPYFTQRLGQAYLDAFENEAAYRAFMIAAQNSRTWARPHRGLAQALLKLDQPAAAFFHAREAHRREDNAASRQWLVLAMVAIADPTDPEAIARTLREADLLDNTSPQTIRVLPAVIDLLARAGRVEQARQRIANTLALQGPLPVQLLESLTQLSQQHQLDMTESIAQTLQAQHGMTRGLALIRATEKANQNGYDAGLALMIKAAPQPMTKPWRTTIAGYTIANNTSDTANTLIELANAYPQDIALQLSALQASSPSLHHQFFEHAIARLREQAGQASIHWRLHLARLRGQDPGNVPALEEAIDHLTRAEKLVPIHLDVQLSLARCHLLLGQDEDAVEHAQIAKTIAANDPQAMMLYGKALYRLNRYEEARIELIPLALNEQLDAPMRLDACQMLFEKGERQVVGQALQSIRSAGQANNQALILLARVYIEQGAFAKADQLCATLLQRPDTQAIRFTANYYRQTQRPELAEQALAAIQTSAVSEADRLMIRAQDAATLGQPEQALALILQAAEQQPNQPARWYTAVQLALSLSQPAEAIRFARLAMTHLPDDAGLASLLKHEKHVMQTGDDQALIPMAVTILNDQANRLSAAEALRLSAQDATPHQIANELADLAQKHADFKYLSELALDHLLLADLNERAYALASMAMARFPDSAASARVATLASYRTGDWAMLLSAANAWSQRNPSDRANADLMRAAAMNELQRYPSTIKTLGPYIQSQQSFDENSAMLFEFYTRALVRSGNADQAWQTLSTYIPSSKQARGIALKRVAEDLDQAQDTVAWLSHLGSQSDDAGTLFETATAAFLAGQRLKDESLVKMARQSIDRVLSMPQPHGIDILYAQGQIAQYLRDWDQAEASYRKVRASLPDNPLVLNNLAMILIERGGSSLREAKQLATRATQLSDKDPNLLDTLAIVYMQQDDLDRAIQTINKAIALDTNNPAWRLTQATILEAKGETDRAAIIREQYEQRLKN